MVENVGVLEIDHNSHSHQIYIKNQSKKLNV